jgi:hypothetical protein
MGVRDKYVNAGTGTDLCRCGMHRTWRSPFPTHRKRSSKFQDQFQAAGTTLSVQIGNNIFEALRMVVSLAAEYARMTHPGFRACRGRRVHTPGSNVLYKLKCGKAVWCIRLM